MGANFYNMSNMLKSKWLIHQQMLLFIALGSGLGGESENDARELLCAKGQVL